MLERILKKKIKKNLSDSLIYYFLFFRTVIIFLEEVFYLNAFYFCEAGIETISVCGR